MPACLPRRRRACRQPSFAALLLACTATLPAPAAPLPPPLDFDAWFCGETLRVDYHHGGDAAEEFIALDRLYRQGAWAGGRRRLNDPLPGGGYGVRAHDAATGTLLFARGFDTYFGEYRTTAEAAAGQVRVYHESVLLPLPRAPVRMVLESRPRGAAPRELFSVEIDPDGPLVRREPPRAGVLVVPAAEAGPPRACLDIAVLGEGYTAGETDRFRADLARFAAVLLAHEPFAEHRERISVRGLLAPSSERGCDEPSRGIFRDTALGLTFDSLGSERYLLTEDNRALRDIAANAPYDVICVMVNHERYGGGGIHNQFCTFTTGNQFSEYVFLHELGHAFAGLADEYYTASVAYNDFYPRGIEPVEPNITALLDPGALKWGELVTPGTPVPTPWEKAAFDEMDLAYQKVREELNEEIALHMRAGARAAADSLLARAEELARAHAARVDAYLAGSAFAGRVGAFAGAGYAAEGLYRSQLDCLMFTKGVKPFCAACRAAVERAIERCLE